MRATQSMLIVLVVLMTRPSVTGHPPELPSSRQTTSALQGTVTPVISSDGLHVVYSSQGSIWRASLQDAAAQQLTDGPTFDCRPAWSPDGSRIAFVRGRGSFNGTVHLMNAADGSPIAMPRHPFAQDRVRFSPHGDKLLGHFFRDGEPGLCWFDLNTGEFGRKLFEMRWTSRFALSKDGKTIVIATTKDLPGQQSGNNGPACDVWILPADGGRATRLCRFPGRVYELTFDADDRSLLVVSNVSGVHNDLWQVPLDDPSGGARQLTYGQADEDAPSVDRSGNRLLFTENRSGPTTLRLWQRSLDHVDDVRIAKRSYRRPSGELDLRLLDEQGQAIPSARLSIRDEAGNQYAPPDAMYRYRLGSEMHFYCEESCRFDVPEGTYQVRANRGPEYDVTKISVEVVAGHTTEASVTLRRWTDQRGRGWYSGESHIHANYGYGHWYNTPRTVWRQSSGEDLVVSNLMVANSEADGVFDRQFFRGRPDPLSTAHTVLYWNQEFRSTFWGHMTLLRLKRLVEPIFTGFAGTTHPHDHPTNADIADHVHDQQGHVNYTHPAHNVKDPYLSAYSAKALPVDVALGKVDSIDVMGSNHEANLPLWYRFLNCGFRLPASAGTDCFLNRVFAKLPGQDRVYVHIDGDFTYAKWIAGLKAGKTFVTNGPMIDFRVDQQMAGQTVQLAGAGSVVANCDVESNFPIDRWELIHNGRVALSGVIGGGTLRANVQVDVPVRRSGWIAWRVQGASHPDQPTGSLFAHSGPVYVNVEGTRPDSADDALFFAKWIDRLRRDARLRNRIPGRHQVAVESQLAEAKAVYHDLIASPQ